MIPKHLEEKIKCIPAKPGIYLMKDTSGHTMYIGKSKSLQSRVKSYFYNKEKQRKIERMIFNIKDIDFIVTDTHLEAQILECVLIKKLKPIYNKQFKNHNKYVYVKIESDSNLKPLTIINSKEEGYCLGPYKSYYKILDALKFLEKIYPIKKNSQGYYFNYNVIPKPLTPAEFNMNRESMIEILSKEECMSGFSEQITKAMEESALKLEYERAIIYRNLLDSVKHLYTYSGLRNPLSGKVILVGEAIENGYKLFYISNNRIILKRKTKVLSEEYIKSFLEDGNDIASKYFNHNINNEKRNLDFINIINRELRDKQSKAMLFIENNVCIESFIDELLEFNKG